MMKFRTRVLALISNGGSFVLCAFDNVLDVQFWKLSTVDLCEIAFNSVYQSGFSHGMSDRHVTRARVCYVL